MADIAGPNILSVERQNGSWIRVVYSAGASGYNRVYIDVRTLDGAWKQATTSDVMNGIITATTIGGVPLQAGVAYQVKLRARHTSNLPVAESGTVNVPAWSVATPTLLAASRPDPTTIGFTYEGATYADGGRLYVDRRETPSGVWGRVTNFVPHPSGTGAYTITAVAGKSYEVRISAGQWGVYSGLSSSRSVNAWETPQPTLVSVTRTSAAAASFEYSGATPGGKLFTQRRVLPTDPWVASGFDTPSASGTYTMSGLAGAAAYEVQLYATSGGVTSAPSSSKNLEAWFSLPAGVSDLSAARRPDGTVDLAWTRTVTTRAPYNGQRVLRAEGELGQLTLLSAGSISGAVGTFHDLTAKPEREYRYTVVPFNDAGEATSRPVVKSSATVLAPNAPSATTAVYVSDTTADVSWPDPATPDRPVVSFTVRRWLLGAWSTVKTGLSGATLSWRDNGLAKNGVYKYQVQAVNAAGVSAAYSPDSAEVITTPAGAATLTAARAGADVKLTWVAPSNSIAASWTVERTTASPVTGGSTWFPVSAGTLAGSARQMVDTSVPAGVSLTYRIRPTLAAAPDAPWVQSGTISPYAAPYAPTLLPVYPFAAAGVIRLGFIHNPSDDTAMSAADVDYRENGGVGGAWVSNEPLYPNTWWDVPAGTFTNGSLIEWRVRTQGHSGGWGPYAFSSFTTRTRPTVAITSPAPASVSNSGTVTVEWVTASQSSYIARLMDVDGNVVDVQSGNTSVGRSVTFTGLADRGNYTVSVVVRDAYQESLPATVAFSVELDRPAPPLLTAVPDPDGGTVLLTATAVQGLKLTRQSWAPPMSDWVRRGVGSPPPMAVVIVGGVERNAMIVAPGVTVQSPAFTVATPAAVTSASTYAEVLSLGGDGAAAVRYIGASDVQEPGGSVEAAPAGVSTRVTGDVIGEWPDGWKLAVENTGATSLYVLDVSGVSRTADAKLEAPFDGDTRSVGYQYGWNPDGTAWEAVPTSDPAQADFPVAETVRIEIIRIGPDGRAITLGDVDGNGQLTDQLPPLGVPVTYIARAWTAARAYADSATQTVQVNGSGVIINWGPGWTGLAIVRANLGFAVESSTNVELVHFDRDDSASPNMPVPFSAGTSTHTSAVTGATADDLGSTEAEWDMVPRQLLVWYRDPEGRSFPASVPSVRFGQEREGQRTLSFVATEVAYSTVGVDA